MVLSKNARAWLHVNQLRAAAAGDGGGKKETIGILAFEVGSTMSRLVSVHRSLSDAGIQRLRSDIMRSPGVSYLTSTDQHFLFRLACADLLSDLDAAAAAVCCLASRCHAEQLLTFPQTYADVKAGRAAVIRIFSAKGLERRVKQMEKSIVTVDRLLEEMEALYDMEAADKKMVKKKPTLEKELRAQRKKVEWIKEESLWSKSFDEVVALMSRALLAVLARLCVLFGPFVNGLPSVLIGGGRMSFTPFTPKFRIYPWFHGRRHSSGPMERASEVKEIAIRNSCPIIGRTKETDAKFPSQTARTVGEAGLTMRYATIVVDAARMMRMSCGEQKLVEGDEESAKEEIYRQLPESLQWAVRGKLRDRWKERGSPDGELAKGWKEAVERILKWLEPVARDTLTWEEERTMDRRRRLNTKPRILAMQTLAFSDRVKTEAVITEVLVGISCMCWYDGRRSAAGTTRSSNRSS